jgi:FKBP-type peptidyl-prolyl cis-trans isomerase FkpA
MKKSLFLGLCLAVLYLQAGAQEFQTTPSGLQYKISPTGNGAQIVQGNFLKMNVIVKLNDSTVFSSYGKAPVYQMVDTAMMFHNLVEVLFKMKEGDSGVCIQNVDTLKNKFGNMPDYLKSGDKVYNYFQVVKIFTNDADAMADYEKEQQKMLDEEIAAVAKYVADNNINAIRTKGGTYVQVIEPGTGAAIDSLCKVTVNYSGRTFAGAKFDSNIDPAFHHVEPFTFALKTNQVIPGWDDGFGVLKKGAKAVLYIPSQRGYGAAGNGEQIKAYDNLIFEVTVLDVQCPAPVKKPAAKPPVKKPAAKKKPVAKKPVVKKKQ